MFESRSAGEPKPSTPTKADHDDMTPPGRYHVTLHIDGRPILDGWWDNPDTADWKFDGFAKEHADNAGARVNLTEWHAGQEWPLREWPTPPAAEDA